MIKELLVTLLHQHKWDVKRLSNDYNNDTGISVWRTRKTCRECGYSKVIRCIAGIGPGGARCHKVSDDD